MKEGLDINKLSTSGTEFEVISNNSPYIEDEEEAEEKLLYQQKVLEHLNPECADFYGDEAEAEENDNDAADVSNKSIVTYLI